MKSDNVERLTRLPCTYRSRGRQNEGRGFHPITSGRCNIDARQGAWRRSANLLACSFSAAGHGDADHRSGKWHKRLQNLGGIEQMG